MSLSDGRLTYNTDNEKLIHIRDSEIQSPGVFNKNGCFNDSLFYFLCLKAKGIAFDAFCFLPDALNQDVILPVEINRRRSLRLLMRMSVCGNRLHKPRRLRARRRKGCRSVRFECPFRRRSCDRSEILRFQ